LSASFLAFLLAAGAGLGLVACGDGGADLLPGGTASEINANLDKVRELVDEGECIGAEDAAQEVSSEVDALGGVDARLKQALREGAARLNEVVASCEEAPVEEETEPAIEPAEELEEVEKEKPDRPEKAKKEAEETETAPTLPPQAEGKAKGPEAQEEEVPPAETGSGGGTPAGGVGPGEAAGGE
jgi:septal ring-binding cell division protein DamX